MTKNTKHDTTNNIKSVHKTNDKIFDEFTVSSERVFQQIIKGEMPTYSETEMNLIIDKL